MFKLGPIIIKLLSENDCVVVPGFGGFVAQYLPAKLDESTGFFSPPSKHVLFNKNLINNDGLLINKIAQNQKINFNEAKEILEEKVKEFNRDLELKQQTNIHDLGTIYIRDEIIKFKQTSENILMESFGLTVINIKEFKQEMAIKQPKVIPLNNPAPLVYQKWWVAAVIVPIIFYTAWVPLKTNLFSENASFHYSDLNPFTFEKISKYSPRNLAPISNNREFTYNEKALNNLKIESTLQLKNIEKSNSSSTIKNIYYHVIVGCFSSKKNADNLVKTLNNKDYKARKLDYNKGLHRISICSFKTKAKAVRFKRKIKSRDGISSWILKK